MLRNLYYACKSLIALNTAKNIEEAQQFAKKIWDRLRNLTDGIYWISDWINTILFIFPIDVAVNIGERANETINPLLYNLKEAEVLLINLDINLSVLLIDDKNILKLFRTWKK